MATNEGLVQKFKIAPFLNKTPNGENPTWIRIKKATAFDLSFNPETLTLDFIADESPSEILKQYKPQINQSITMYKGEPDYDYIFDRLFNMDTGADAETDFLLVFFQEENTVGAKTYYKAWQSKCMLSLADMNSVDSTITFNISLNGTIDRGYIELVDGSPVFKSGAIPNA